MADRKLETLLGAGRSSKGPRWRDGRWWVSDFFGCAVLSVTTDGVVEEELTVEQQPSGTGWMPDGSLLVVSMRDHRVLRRSPDGEVSVHAEVSEHCGGHLNDMVVDGEGRAYIGNFGFDLMGGGHPATANLVRVDPDGSATVAAEDLRFPNGSVITPDGKTLIVGETRRSLLHGVHDRRRRVALRSPPVGTDGFRTRARAAGGDDPPARVRTRRLCTRR